MNTVILIRKKALKFYTKREAREWINENQTKYPRYIIILTKDIIQIVRDYQASGLNFDVLRNYVKKRGYPETLAELIKTNNKIRHWKKYTSRIEVLNIWR